MNIHTVYSWGMWPEPPLFLPSFLMMCFAVSLHFHESQDSLKRARHKSSSTSETNKCLLRIKASSSTLKIMLLSKLLLPFYCRLTVLNTGWIISGLQEIKHGILKKHGIIHQIVINRPLWTCMLACSLISGLWPSQDISLGKRYTL